MSALQCPLHLLLLDEPSTYHVIDRRLDERRADRLALTVALPNVWNELPIV